MSKVLYVQICDTIRSLYINFNRYVCVLLIILSTVRMDISSKYYFICCMHAVSYLKNINLINNYKS